MSEQYKQAIAELETFYGGNVLNGGILEATWISEMQKLPIQQIQVGIARCFKKHPRKYNYFPSPDEILDLAKGSVHAENAQAYATADLTKPALPAAYEGISPEEAETTKRELLIGKLFLASRHSLSEEEKDSFPSQMREFPTHELERMLSVAKSPVIANEKFSSACNTALKLFESLAAQAGNAIFEDMKKYLRSDVEKHRQDAIDWAVKNGYQLIKKNGQIVDIKEVEF